MAVLQSIQAMQARIAELEAQNEQLKARGQRKLTMKVAPSGALSVYHGSRFPTTLYRSQWEKVLAAKEEIEAFIKAHASELSVKE